MTDGVAGKRRAPSAFEKLQTIAPVLVLSAILLGGTGYFAVWNKRSVRSHDRSDAVDVLTLSTDDAARAQAAALATNETVLLLQTLHGAAMGPPGEASKDSREYLAQLADLAAKLAASAKGTNK